MKLKRLILLVFIVGLFSCPAFSLNLFSDNFFAAEDNDNWTGNFGMSFFFPVDKNENAGWNILGSLLLSCFTAGYGYSFDIVPGVFSPGIYGDLHTSWISLLTVETNSDGETTVFFYVQAGIRLFNQFRWELFDIQPFAGVNYVFANNFISGAAAFGCLFAYENYSLEYGFHIPLPNFDRKFSNDNVHRIVFAKHKR